MAILASSISPARDSSDIGRLNGLLRAKLQDILFQRYLRSIDFPTILYQMGKVGSTAVLRALSRAGVRPVFHCHRLLPQTIRETALRRERNGCTPLPWEAEAEILHRNVIRPRRKVKIVTPIREPLGHAVSNFFQAPREFSGVPYDEIAAMTPADLRQVFWRCAPLDYCQAWFENEISVALDYDFLAEPLNDDGYRIVETEWYSVLIFRIEMDRSDAESLLGSFFDTPGISIEPANVTERKDWEKAAAYRELREGIKFSAEQVDAFKSMPYTKRFYNCAALDRAIARWT